MFTRFGFFSIVDNSEQTPRTVAVRARCKSHLANLQKAFKLSAKILELPDRDYGFRIILSTGDWKYIASEICKDAEQTDNFKERVKTSLPYDYGYAHWLSLVWGDGRKFQETRIPDHDATD